MNRTVGYCSPYLPVEWILAHQLVPKRIVPGAYPDDAPVAHLPGLCPVARSFGSFVASSTSFAGFVFSTRCDQMRRMSEVASLLTSVPVHLFGFPHVRSDGAASMFRFELERMSAFLASLGGCLSLDMLRASLHASIESEVFAGKVPALPAISLNGEPSAKRIALVGGPLLSEHSIVYDMIRESGGEVVLDGTERSTRCQPSFDPSMVEKDPVEALVQGYTSNIADVFVRPNDAFFSWLVGAVKESGAQGVIVHRYLWCDIWHAEVQRIKEALDIPVIDIDSDLGPFDTGRTVTRLKAFLEVV